MNNKVHVHQNFFICSPRLQGEYNNREIKLRAYMSDTAAPPLWAVLGSLGNIILSVGMIWYLLLFLSSCSSCPARPFAFIFIFAFGIIIALSGFELFRLLFSERKKSCPVCSLVAKMIEIDGKVP
jgi:hypothetical protein